MNIDMDTNMLIRSSSAIVILLLSVTSLPQHIWRHEADVLWVKAVSLCRENVTSLTDPVSLTLTAKFSSRASFTNDVLLTKLLVLLNADECIVISTKNVKDRS